MEVPMSEPDDVQSTIGVIDGLRERIAELEQKAAADREYMDKAEKRIAELEARSAKDFADWEEAAAKAEALLNKVIAELQAERAALRGRRCETCASGESQGDIIQLVICRAVGRFSATNTLVAPFTHSCSWWTAREETP